MHIPDGFLDVKTCAGAFGVAGAGLGVALRQVNARWNDKTVPLMGVMSAFIFAGQMVNFPVAAGTSGHLQGAVLASVFLGPCGAAVVMATVLFVQCFLFQDGGVTALGANLVNLGLVSVATGYGLFWLLRRSFPDPSRIALWAAVGSWFSVVCASVACSAELAASGTIPLAASLPAMALTHAVIGFGEALITGTVVSFVSRVRPDLLYAPDKRIGAATLSTESFAPYLGFGLLFAMGMALLVSPFASSWPDGLESLAEQFHVGERAARNVSAPLAEGVFPGIQTEWLAASLAAGLGTLAAFAVAWGIGRWLRRPRSESRAE